MVITTNVWKYLWHYLSKLKFLFFSVLASVVLGEFFTRLALYYSSQIVETLSSNLGREEIFQKSLYFAVLVSVLYFAKGFFINIILFLEARFLPVYISRMAKDLFNFAHKHSTAFFAEEMAGNISSKIKTIIEDGNSIYYVTLWGLVSPLIGLIISFLFMVNINLELSMILLGLNIVLIFILFKLSGKLAPYSEDRARLMSEANGTLVDSISNAGLVKNFSNYLHEKKNYFKAVKLAARADGIETRKYGILYILQGSILSVMQTVFYILPIFYWYHGEINVGEFVLIQSLVFSLVVDYDMLASTFMNFFKLYGGVQDGLKLLSKPSEINDVPNASKLDVKKAEINFEHVTYHYKNSNPLFEDFNLKIKAGEKIGLVGRSGSGKSTLVKILSRYYDIQDGKISIDSQNISQVTQDSLRRSIALIPQDPSLFNRSIMENIRYGNLQATDEEVFEAAKKAYIHDFILSLPAGYESKVGERGVMLSGGERQRIAIARAVLKNAPILILDEATSALDSESERFIQESLRELMKGKTVIAIAHRLSTLREMDRLIIMDKGKIIEEGAHQSLVRKKGAYYRFYSMQTSGFLKIERDEDGD